MVVVRDENVSVASFVDVVAEVVVDAAINIDVVAVAFVVAAAVEVADIMVRMVNIINDKIVNCEAIEENDEVVRKPDVTTDAVSLVNDRTISMAVENICISALEVIKGVQVELKNTAASIGIMLFNVSVVVALVSLVVVVDVVSVEFVVAEFVNGKFVVRTFDGVSIESSLHDIISGSDDVSNGLDFDAAVEKH
ncbi:hypothetical protein HELRODRAFT_165814 [Helobdella robusta]|uniref:Uncharacterized protein n=1 Tax=Helobdella robusta TaxID=6412 RepID=T1EXB3_HELRO|nr:hypothetical protein HELRODRAFT_165814 [Helobdella robusta]ESN91746.1 hypothetical protein HELRODRAFT_165814 [Helobdella robusta]